MKLKVKNMELRNEQNDHDEFQDDLDAEQEAHADEHGDLGTTSKPLQAPKLPEKENMEQLRQRA